MRPEKKRTKLARVYFRIDNMQIDHERSVEGFMDFLGNIAGIYELFARLSVLLIGSFSMLHQ